jgi:hypothetical protein
VRSNELFRDGPEPVKCYVEERRAALLVLEIDVTAGCRKRVAPEFSTFDFFPISENGISQLSTSGRRTAVELCTQYKLNCTAFQKSTSGGCGLFFIFLIILEGVILENETFQTFRSIHGTARQTCCTAVCARTRHGMSRDFGHQHSQAQESQT